MKSRLVRNFALVAITALLGAQSASANVGATYLGVIDSDGGLGLIGQTMQVDIIYDETVSYNGAPSAVAWYDGFITSMTVSIGTNAWVFDTQAGGSSATITNNYLRSYFVGVEDSFSAYADTFTGPSVAPLAAPVDDWAYSFWLSLSDNTPTGAPDALSTNLALPATAPDPANFNTPAIIGSTQGSLMQFSFYTGDGETGDFYHIETSSVSLVTAVPEPETYAMFLAGLGIVGAVARRRAAR